MADVIEEGGNGVDKDEAAKVLDALKTAKVQRTITELGQPKIDEQSEFDTARAILRKEQEDRIEKCKAEVDAVMKKWGCTFDAAMLVSNRGNRVILNVVVLQGPS